MTMTINQFSLGDVQSFRVPNREKTFIKCWPILDTNGQKLGVTVRATQQTDGSFHQFGIFTDKHKLNTPKELPDLTSRLFREEMDAAAGLMWEWAAEQCAHGQVPTCRPGHPEDSTLTLLAQGFHELVFSMQSDDSTFPQIKSLAAPLVVQRLIKAGWPVTDGDQTAWRDALQALNSLAGKVHSCPVEIHARSGPLTPAMAVLEDGSKVRCQNLYRVEEAVREALLTGSLFPPDLKVRINSAPTTTKVVAVKP
jgi:hypothetical protein